MMQAIATLDPQDLKEYLDKFQSMITGQISAEEYQAYYRHLAEKYRFDARRAQIMFSTGVVFVEVPDIIGLN